jgi:RNase P subunit RPR2
MRISQWLETELPMNFEDVPCPDCGKKTLEERTRKDPHFGRNTLFLFCTTCGEEKNRYDIGRQLVRETRKPTKEP